MAEAVNYGDASSATRTCDYRDCRPGQCSMLPLKLRWLDDSGGSNGGGSGGNNDDDYEGYRAALGSLSSALRQ